MAAIILNDRRGNELTIDRDEALVAVTVESSSLGRWQMVQITPAQARELAAQLLTLAAEIEAPDAPPDQIH